MQNVSESLEERLETQTEPPLEETEHFLEELDLGDLGPIAEEGSDEKSGSWSPHNLERFDWFDRLDWFDNLTRSNG